VILNIPIKFILKNKSVPLVNVGKRKRKGKRKSNEKASGIFRNLRP
jgi:hypothetical protein